MDFTEDQIRRAIDNACDCVSREHHGLKGAIVTGQYREYLLKELSLYKAPVLIPRAYQCPLCDERVMGTSIDTAMCEACEYTIADAQALWEGTRQKRNAPPPSRVQAAQKSQPPAVKAPVRTQAAVVAPPPAGSTWICEGCETVNKETKKNRCSCCTLKKDHFKK